MRINTKTVADYFDLGEMLDIPAIEVSNFELLPAAPTVSVILMTRNHEAFVEQAVNSILDQKTNFDFEILIGEDYSSDGTKPLCEGLQRQRPEKIRLIFADRNVGITPNFLRLVARCRGEYIALLEGDDYWTNPKKLSKQVKLLNDHPDYAWCGARTGNRTMCVPIKEFYTLDETLRRYIVHTSTVVFRRRHLSTYPHFPDVVGWISMVYAYLATWGPCGFIDEELSYYRHHEGGVWTGSTVQERQKLTEIFVDTMNEYFPNEFKKELADRELWVFDLSIDMVIANWNWKVWLCLYQSLPALAERCLGLKFWKFVRLASKITFAPLIVFIRLIRRTLAIRTRLSTLISR